MKTTTNRTRAFFLVIFTVLVFVSCAQNTYQRGAQLLERKSYDEAITALEQAELENPNNYQVIRDLGVAYYKTGRLDNAIEKLSTAHQLNTKDSKTVFFLGICYERKNMLTDALAQYKKYRKLKGSRTFKNAIAVRMKQLLYRKMSGKVTAAIAEEANLDVAAIPEHTVAVLPFTNLGSNAELNPLEKGLTEMLITDLAKARKLRVVERLHLQILKKELSLAASELVNPATAPRIGRLLGVRKLVSGGYLDLADNNFRIDAKITKTASAEKNELEEITGDFEQLLRLEKQLVFKVIDEMEIVLSRQERLEIEKIPTESMLAFLAYSRGLEFEDRGQFSQAKQQYKQAVALDPKFNFAKASLKDVDATESAQNTPLADIDKLTSDFETTDQEAPSNRLLATGIAVLTGQVPQQGNDTRQATMEATGKNQLNPNAATLSLTIPVPDNQ